MSTAGMVLAAIFAVFAFLEKLLEVFDAVAGKGGRRLIAGPPDGEAPVFRLHLQGDFFQLVNISPSISATRLMAKRNSVPP